MRNKIAIVRSPSISNEIETIDASSSVFLSIHKFVSINNFQRWRDEDGVRWRERLVQTIRAVGVQVSSLGRFSCIDKKQFYR